MGFSMRIVFATLDVAGELIGLQMGLSFASFFDPQSAGTTSVVAQIIGLVVSLIFLSLNGHLMLVEVLSRSFEWLPISADPMHAEGWLMLARSGSVLFATGLLLALPVVGRPAHHQYRPGRADARCPAAQSVCGGFPITSTVGIAVIWLTLQRWRMCWSRFSMPASKAWPCSCGCGPGTRVLPGETCSRILSFGPPSSLSPLRPLKVDPGACPRVCYNPADSGRNSIMLAATSNPFHLVSTQSATPMSKTHRVQDRYAFRHVGSHPRTR